LSEALRACLPVLDSCSLFSTSGAVGALERLLCGQLLINTAFALFAVDALVFVWLELVLGPSRELLREAKTAIEVARRQLGTYEEKLKTAAHLGLERDDAEILERLAAADLGRRRRLVDGCINPLQQSVASSDSMRRFALWLAMFDVLYLLVATVVYDLSTATTIAEEGCEFAVLLFATILAFLHATLYYAAWRHRRRVERARAAANQTMEMALILDAGQQPPAPTSLVRI
jgi:hypothetical protein